MKIKQSELFYKYITIPFKDQQMKFDTLAIFGLIKRVYYSDFCIRGPNDSKTWKKESATFWTCGYTVEQHMHPTVHTFFKGP